ncbi:MAG: hypothetical protein E6R13_01715 [Spirochaetes bacterium]|nr:MAG: hypothetical protein E6R13_01715 [Spirochaetota bacterium]
MKNRILNLQLVYDIVTAFGHYTEFNLYKKSYNINTEYKDVEKLTPILSFITQTEINTSDLIQSEDEKINNLLNAYVNLEESYKKLKQYNLSKTKAKKIFKKLNKTILISPQYYLSIPHNCFYLKHYILNNITKNELINNFILFGFNNNKQMHPKIFYKIYTNVLNEYKKCIN